MGGFDSRCVHNPFLREIRFKSESRAKIAQVLSARHRLAVDSI
nr:MAG TPA: hypothetical protein [Caudoviricetes sp.]